VRRRRSRKPLAGSAALQTERNDLEEVRQVQKLLTQRIRFNTPLRGTQRRKEAEIKKLLSLTKLETNIPSSHPFSRREKGIANVSARQGEGKQHEDFQTVIYICKAQ
jgi:hypothetical protein